MANLKKMNEYEPYRVTRWLIAADPSHLMMDGKQINSSMDTTEEYGKSMSNSRWCVREVARLKAKGVTAYTKRAGKYVALYSRLTTKQMLDLRSTDFSEDVVEQFYQSERKEMED